MLSGGVESSALVQHSVDENIEAECVHVIWDNKTKREAVNAKKIAEHYNVLYNEIHMKVGEFNGKYGSVARQDKLWWTCGILTIAPLGNYDQIWMGTHCDEISPVALGPAGVALLLNSVGCNATMESPLHSYTKQEQYYSLPKEIKDLVISCNRITSDGSPCGICEKCIEWKNFAISA